MSTLTPQRKKELAQAKDKELNTWMEHAVVEAAARKGIPPAALMKMRWAVTTKADDSLKARLVVQGFTDTRLGTNKTSSPTSSRRARQIFPTGQWHPYIFNATKEMSSARFLKVTWTERALVRVIPHKTSKQQTAHSSKKMCSASPVPN